MCDRRPRSNAVTDKCERAQFTDPPDGGLERCGRVTNPTTPKVSLMYIN